MDKYLIFFANQSHFAILPITLSKVIVSVFALIMTILRKSYINNLKMYPNKKYTIPSNGFKINVHFQTTQSIVSFYSHIISTSICFIKFGVIANCQNINLIPAFRLSLHNRIPLHLSVL